MTNLITIDDVHLALKRVRREHGHPAARAILKRVAGVTQLDDLRAEQYADVISACTGGAVVGRPNVKSDGGLNAEAIYAKWNSPGARGMSSSVENSVSSD